MTAISTTSMHSSRMRTARLLDRIPACTVHGGVYIPACTGQGCVYPSMHWAGGGLPAGVSAQGGVCLGVGGCLPDTYPVDRMTDRFKNITLPQRNFVAGGKNYIFLSKSDRQLRNLRLTNYQWTLYVRMDNFK